MRNKAVRYLIRKSLSKDKGTENTSHGGDGVAWKPAGLKEPSDHSPTVDVSGPFFGKILVCVQKLGKIAPTRAASIPAQ